MKKQIRLLYLILGICTFIYPQDERSEKLLNEVSEEMATYKNISVSFSYELINRNELIQQKEKGVLMIQGNTYLLELMGVKQICDGNNIYSINPENEEVLIEKVSEDNSEGLNPSKLFTFYKEGYKFEWDILQPLYGTNKIQFIKLIPIDTYAQTSYFLLGINIKTKQIYKLIEVDNSGTETTLTISSFKKNTIIDSSNFIFSEDDYPNYYIDRF